MEFKEISAQLVAIVAYVESASDWVNSRIIAAGTHVSPGTVRHHLLRLHRLGIVDVVRLYPGYRYRLAEKAKSQEFWSRYEAARVGFGRPPEEGAGIGVSVSRDLREMQSRHREGLALSRYHSAGS